MASYRSYGDSGAYRSRTGIASSTFGRTTSAASNLPSCRTSYSSIGSSRIPAKDRVSSFGNAFLKKDKADEKSFKYSATKESDKSRLHPGRSSSEDVRAKSPLSSSRSSLFEKYSFPAAKTSDRPASVLDRYNRATSREKSRESDGVSRYGSSTYPGSGLARSYGNECRIEKKERSDHPPVSYRGLRPNSGRSSREPSPEVSVGKSNSFRVYSRASSYGRSAANSSASESSSAPISSRFGSSASSRFLSPRSSNDRVPSAISYSGSDRFRTSGSKPMPASSKNEDSAKTSSEKDSSQEPFAKPEGLEGDSRLQDNDTLTLTMVTRGTSPSPPASSSYVRSRRADVGIAHQKEVTRVRRRPETKDQEVQCDRTEDGSRFSRFGGRISESPWSSYLDKFSTSNSGGTGVYGRSYNSSGGATNSRVNSFAFSRSNDNGIASRNDSASKVSPASSQEIQSSRNQNEQSAKVFGSLSYPRAGQDAPSAKAESLKTSSNPGQANSSKDQTNAKLQTGDSRAAAKTEARSDRFSNSKSFNNDSLVSLKRETTPKQSTIVAKSSDSRESISRGEDAQSSRESSLSKSEGNQRRPSIPRLGGRGPMKNETKIMKSSSGSSTKSDGLRERRGSTPKSDGSTFSRAEESSRIVEGYCQEQSEDIASSKRDNASVGKESVQSATLVSRSSTSQSRSSSSRNLPRQMTRADSSDGSAVNVPIGRSKSSSASSMTSQGSKIKATPSPSPSPGKSSGGSAASSVNLRQGGSPDARGKPPVPKPDVTASTASKCLVPVKYVNKDFRKSTLNMENGDPSQSKLSRKKKSQRSMSASSQDSQSEPNSEPLHQAVPSESSGSLKTSASRLRMPSSGSKGSTSRSGASGSSRSEKLRSGSRSPAGNREKEDGSSSSSANSESNSSNSSSSEDDDEKQTRPGSRRRRRRTSESPFREKRGKISAGSSRTSVVASSADETSLTMDKPPRPPSSPRSKSDRSGKTEEAKSFLMRALAPVTNLFKNKQDSGESGKSGGWLDSNEDSTDVRKSEHNTASLPRSLSKSGSFTGSEKSDDRRQGRQKIRRDYSGEQPWWMDPNSDNVPEGVETRSVCNDDISQETTVSGTLPDDGKFKYRLWRQDSEERGWWLDSNDSVVTEDAKKYSSATSRQESGDKTWWLDSNDSTRSDETKKQCSSIVSRPDSGDRARWLDGNDSVPSEEPRRSSSSSAWRQESGERAWWFDANDNVSSEEPRKQSSSSSSVSRRGSTRCSTRSSERRNRIKHQQSGERAWWMSDDPENVPEGIEVIPVTTTGSPRVSSQSDEVDTSHSYRSSINKIRHIESGEKAWWMDSSSNVPEGVVKIPMETSNSTSDSSESLERIDIGVHPEPEIYTKRSLSRFPIEFPPPPPPDEPLGDRASPEGVENPPDPPDNYGGRDSPYDNVQPTPRRSSPRKRPSTLPLFIGEHTNIDDLLGDTGTLCPSPVLSLLRKRERERERERIEEDSSESSECEEIDATQVIIHDSTPQTPVIQRRHRDNERPQPDGYIPLLLIATYSRGYCPETKPMRTY